MERQPWSQQFAWKSFPNFHSGENCFINFTTTPVCTHIRTSDRIRKVLELISDSQSNLFAKQRTANNQSDSAEHMAINDYRYRGSRLAPIHQFLTHAPCTYFTLIDKTCTGCHRAWAWGKKKQWSSYLYLGGYNNFRFLFSRLNSMFAYMPTATRHYGPEIRNLDQNPKMMILKMNTAYYERKRLQQTVSLSGRNRSM